MWRRLVIPIYILLLLALGSPAGAAPVAPTPSPSDDRVLGCEWRTLFDHSTYERVLVATDPTEAEMELIVRVLEDRARSLTGGRCRVELLDEDRVRVVLGPLLPQGQLSTAELDETLSMPGAVTVVLALAGELADGDGRGYDPDSPSVLASGQIYVQHLFWTDEDGRTCFMAVVDELIGEAITRQSSVVDDQPTDLAIVVDGTAVFAARVPPGFRGRDLELCASSFERIAKQLHVVSGSDPLPVELRPEGTVATPVSSPDGLSQK